MLITNVFVGENVLFEILFAFEKSLDSTNSI